MQGCLGAENSWSRFLVVLSLGAVAVGLALLLTFVWRLDLATSPAWQVAVYHGMLALLASMTILVASCSPLCPGRNFRWLRWFLVGLALLSPVVVFSAGWVLVGPYSGFRDDRIFDLTVVSVSGYMLIWMSIVFPLVGFLLGMKLVRLWRCGVEVSPESS